MEKTCPVIYWFFHTLKTNYQPERVTPSRRSHRQGRFRERGTPPRKGGGGGEGLEDLVVSRLNLPNSPIRLCNIWCSPQWQLIVSHLFIASLYSKFTTTDSSSVLSENHGISPKILPPLPAMNNFPYLQQKLLWLKSLSRLQSIRNINNPQHPPTAHAW